MRHALESKLIPEEFRFRLCETFNFVMEDPVTEVPKVYDEAYYAGRERIRSSITSTSWKRRAKDV